MKFFCVHLMPYAHLDLNYTEKYNSAWVTLPNSYYDPVKGHARDVHLRCYTFGFCG